MPSMSARENGTLPILGRLSRWGFPARPREQALWNAMSRRLELKSASPDVPVEALSGGNQQKVLLARSLLADPEVLFLDDPTRGIDISAKHDVYQLIDQLKANGKGVILASSELPELLRCSDRILVLSNGRSAGIYPAGEATQESIMAAATQPLLARAS